MPVRVSSPGTYSEEIQSGRPRIRAAPTSTAAFVGCAPRGPADTPVPCASWADFARHFGDLDNQSLLGNAVSHFFTSGGSSCLAVRLRLPEDRIATAATCGLELQAIGPGTWANGIRIEITPDVALGGDRFVLKAVRISDEEVLESFADLSRDRADDRFVGAVLSATSTLLVLTAADDASDGASGRVNLAGGIGGDPMAPSEAPFGAALFGDGSTTGVHVLNSVEQFDLLNVPGYVDAAGLMTLAEFCLDRRAMLIIDADGGGGGGDGAVIDAVAPAVSGPGLINAALYYPWILTRGGQPPGQLRAHPPGGAVAGAIARSDALHGVWKPPAGKAASLAVAADVAVTVSHEVAGMLNLRGVNCIQLSPNYGTVVGGARTLAGNSSMEWKYLAVRRTALLIENSLRQGMEIVARSANDADLLQRVQAAAASFLDDLRQQGAFRGAKPSEAYFARCDESTTTPDDRRSGVVNLHVGFAPLRPAEFVTLRLRLRAAPLED